MVGLKDVRRERRLEKVRTKLGQKERRRTIEGRCVWLEKERVRVEDRRRETLEQIIIHHLSSLHANGSSIYTTTTTTVITASIYPMI